MSGLKLFLSNSKYKFIKETQIMTYPAGTCFEKKAKHRKIDDNDQ